MAEAIPNDDTSPPPEAPPSTSAAHGPRVEMLYSLFNGALQSVLGKVSYSNFAQCFPTTAEYKPDNLRRFHDKFVTDLGRECKVSECAHLIMPLADPDTFSPETIR
jgi:hypothetical protein